jgi:hypothetical protein
MVDKESRNEQGAEAHFGLPVAMTKRAKGSSCAESKRSFMAIELHLYATNGLQK